MQPLHCTAPFTRLHAEHPTGQLTHVAPDKKSRVQQAIISGGDLSVQLEAAASL